MSNNIEQYRNLWISVSEYLFTWTRGSKLPRGNGWPRASVTSRSHYNFLGKLSIIWWLRIDLNSFSFDTNCYIEWILGTVTYFWYFLDLFTLKFILNINNEHEQVYTIHMTTFSFCSYGAKLPWQGWLPGVVQRVIRLSKLPQGNEKLMWTVTGVRPCTKAKFSLGSVSCLEIMWIGSNSLWLSAGCNTLSRYPVENVAVDKWKVLWEPGPLKAVFYFKISLLL